MNKRSREFNSIRNVVIGITSQSLLLVMNFVAKSVFIKVLGADYLGVNGLFSNIFLLFSFAEFGIGSAMIYSLYEPLARQDLDKISALYHYYRRLCRILSVLVATAGVCVIPFLHYIVKTRSEISGIYIFYLVFLANTVLYNLLSYKTYLLVADQEEYKVSLIRMTFDSLNMVLQVVVLLTTHNYLLYLILLCFKTVATYLATSKAVANAYPFLDQKAILAKEDRTKIMINVRALFIYKFARVLLEGTNNIIISILVGTVWVGYYSNYDLIIIGLTSIVTLVFSAVAASIGNLVAEKDPQGMYEVFKVVQVAGAWITGFCTICLLVLFQDFIELWIGKEYVLSYPIVAVITLNFYLNCVRDSVKIFREAVGIFVKVKNMVIVTATINLILSFALGKVYGVFGVLIATSIAVLVTYFWYEPLLIFKSMKKGHIAWYFAFQAFSVLLVFFGTYLINALTGRIQGATIGGFLIKMIVCAVVINGYYFVIFGRTREVRYIFGAVRNIHNRSN